MCGYCIEGLVLDFIEHEKASEKVDLENILIPNYLQESENIPEIICGLKKFDNFPESIDVVFYRIWEMLVFQKYDGIYQSLIHDFDAESINDFLTEIRNTSDFKACEVLGNNELYIGHDYYEQLISNKKQLVDDSVEKLKAYYDFWLLGNNKETSDPEKRMEETGIMDPIENAAPKDCDRFYSLFPVVYFSFLILTRYKSDSGILKHIALESPHDTPDFIGYDLWLQRKAFAACVKNYGVQFILDNYDDIRLELIYYSLLKESVSIVDLDILKNHLLSNDHWVNIVDSDSVVELINNLKSRV